MASPVHARATPAPSSKSSSSNSSPARGNYRTPQNTEGDSLDWSSPKHSASFPPTIDQPSPPGEPLSAFILRLFGPGHLPNPDTLNRSHQCQNHSHRDVFSPGPQPTDQDLGSPATSLKLISAGSQQPILDPEKNGPNVSPGSLFIGTQYQGGVINSSRHSELGRGSTTPELQPADFRSPMTFPGYFPLANQQLAFGFEQEQDHPDNLSPHITEHQENGINHENLQSEPNRALGPAYLQTSDAIPSLDIPVTLINTAHRSRDQNFQCGDRCRVSVGSHKCSYRGRALTISCRGNDDCSQEFTKKNDFNRHWNNIHNNKELFSCPVPDCKRVGQNGFKRKDNLTQHRRLVHREVIEKNPVRFGRDNAGDPEFGGTGLVEG